MKLKSFAILLLLLTSLVVVDGCTTDVGKRCQASYECSFDLICRFPPNSKIGVCTYPTSRFDAASITSKPPTVTVIVDAANDLNNSLLDAGVE